MLPEPEPEYFIRQKISRKQQQQMTNTASAADGRKVEKTIKTLFDWFYYSSLLSGCLHSLLGIKWIQEFYVYTLFRYIYVAYGHESP